MSLSKVDALLHPVRMRIAQTLINGRRLTAQQIGGKLKDIPQATLYRHLNKLLAANVIEVVAEKPIRGAVEKVYALPEENESLTDEDLRHADAETHMDYFMKFITIVLADFERYLKQDDVDPRKDAAGYRQVSFYASDDELFQFIEAMQKELMQLVQNEADGVRRKRTFTTILTTEKNQQPKMGGNDNDQ